MFETARAESGAQAEVVILGVFAEEAPEAAEAAGFADAAVQSALKRREFTGKVGFLAEAFAGTGETRFLLAGLGKRGEMRAEILRRVAASVGRRLAEIRAETALVELTATLAKSGMDAQAAGRCFGETLGLLAWQGRIYAGSATETPPRSSLTLLAANADFTAGMDYGLQIAASTNFARTLSQTPPNIATPLWMAAQARQMAAETGLSCRVIEGAELEAERLTGLVSVGQASAHPPCLIRLEYRPETAGADAKPVVLLGKTITYDTGGLSLKVNNGMVGMKRDKDGGCAVLGAMRCVATLLKPDFPVVGLLAAAENSVSDNAFRPDDVLTYRNGVTVEVTNTDAEGRLVLADGLCWACEVEGARRIVDLATLTGGVVTALGSTFAGYFCDDAELRAQLEDAAERSGELLWRLPLRAEYREMLKSPVADIINSNANRKAHPIQGAAFLSYFVSEDVPWAHIDIAGVHSVSEDSGAFIKGPTGYGVRLLAEWIAAQNAA